ncbi:hypothetical protein [Aeromonas sp. Y318-1]|uniref:hypothetical protein n=1 Tax=Aeromonas TaxID=642 RepID=UPI0022E3ECAA|nr:hypothetical protein [Aeromonas sp. Y318-1]
MQQVGAAALLKEESVSSRSRRHPPRYSEIAQWIYEQRRWVTRREIAQQFGLTRAAVASYLSVIAARRPSVGLQQSQAHNRGSVSVRVMASPDIWSEGIVSAQGVSLHPVPSSSEHARWLALVQRPWSELADDERFHGVCLRDVKEGLVTQMK